MKQTKVNQWTLALAAGGAISLASAGTAAAETTNAPPATPPPYGAKPTESFWKRLNEAELAQMATPCYTPPATNAPAAPTRRIGPTPFDSPPYPDMDWQIGGGPNVIGDPGALRDSPFPLMQAIYDGAWGKAWYDSRIQFYGWITASGNVSTSTRTTYGKDFNTQLETSGDNPPLNNYPEVYDERSDRLEFDQAVMYVERMADENQTDHVDWGFRLALLYGLDYRYMTSRGYLSDQLLRNNRMSGFDTPMMYANLYIPQILDGEQIIFGRIISLPDIEQQLAPNNLMGSHSLVYSFDNYTMWGIWTTTKINANWAVQLGLTTAADTAPWETEDPGDQPTASMLVQYIASGGNDEIYGGMNSLNNGNFGFNNLQECIVSYSHKFSDKCWTTFEAQYMYMKNAITWQAQQTLYGGTGNGPVPYQDGFYPTQHGGFTGDGGHFEKAGGLLNYSMYRVADNAFLTLRNEWWDDPDGFRSGYCADYYEGSIGAQYWPSKLIMLRPEIRFEHSFGSMAYDLGSRSSQVTLFCDLTYHF